MRNVLPNSTNWLKARLKKSKQELEEAEKAVTDVDEFIQRMKKHLHAPKLTREPCPELFITASKCKFIGGGMPRLIEDTLFDEAQEELKNAY